MCQLDIINWMQSGGHVINMCQLDKISWVRPEELVEILNILRAEIPTSPGQAGRTPRAGSDSFSVVVMANQ